MPVIDVCFFVPRLERQQLEKLLEPFICERAEVDRYQDGYDYLARYVVRLWSVKITQELLAELKEAGIIIGSDVYFSLPYSDVAEARAHDLIGEFLSADVIVKKKIYDAFLGLGILDRTKVLSYDILLLLPEEEKRAAVEKFVEKLQVSGIVPVGKKWQIYMPKYLP